MRRNSPSALVAMLLFILLKPVVTQTPTSSPSLTTGQCINDYHPGSIPANGNKCTSNSLEFLGVVGFTTAPHGLIQDPCNCDGAPSGDTSPPCTSPTLAPGEISCINERGQFEHGTVFGACRGIDDYVEISITGRLAVKNSVVSTYYGSFAFLFDLICPTSKNNL